jgi:hypothetical protein
MVMELGTNNAFKTIQSLKFIVVDHWRVKIKDITHHLYNQRSWAWDMFVELDAANQMLTMKEIVHIGLK